MSVNPSKHLNRAAEAVRAFNHASQQQGEGWEYPSDAYAALGGLSYLTGMLAQAIEQATRPVRWTADRGEFRMDGGMDPVAALDALQHARNVAADTAARLTEAVGHLHNTTSAMGATITEDAEPTKCQKCGTRFDESDMRFWLSKRRYGVSPWCGACVDHCHDSEIADHRCEVCA